MNSNRIVLRGLVGSHPLGALGAFGLLRLCARSERFRDAALHWTAEDDWVATLRVPTQEDASSLIRFLAEQHRARTSFPWIEWAQDLRVSPDRLSDTARECLERSSPEDREEADFLASYGCEVYVDGKGNLAPTLLHMTSGNQKFLRLLSELAASLRSKQSRSQRKTSPEDAFREALLGPWTYGDTEHSLGWDPDQERMHALRHREPSGDPGGKSVRGAVWLAFQAFPFYPVVPGETRPRTSGFRRREKAWAFRWPLWSPPVGLDELRSLLVSSELQGAPQDLERLGGRGVTAVFEARRYSFGQGYGIFRPAAPVFLAPEDPREPPAPMVFPGDPR